jgi:RimJ/RimL family protein N-acetyltransferase
MVGLGHTATITTARLSLDPLRVDDAREMVEVLGDSNLYEFTGGEPPTFDELRDRYRAWVERGSGLKTELWLNWIIRIRAGLVAIGTAQATIVNADSRPDAFVAWTIGARWQRQGYATEATRALVQWLVDNGAESVFAHIRADHIASSGVAANAGLQPTSDVVDGEIVWRLPPGRSQSV